MNSNKKSERQAVLLGGVFGLIFSSVVIIVAVASQGRFDLSVNIVLQLLGLPSYVAAFLMYPFASSMVFGPVITEALSFVVFFLANAVGYALLFWLIYKGYKRVKN